MTQEDKELLLQDLSARLSYGVICKVEFKDSEGWKIQDMLLEGVFTNEYYFTTDTGSIYSEEFKPYFRSMSSMTKEEFEKLKEYSGLKYEQLDLASYQNGTYKCLDFYLSEVPSYVVILVFDWLNEHHFDYRGLIEKNLALDCTGLHIYD